MGRYTDARYTESSLSKRDKGCKYYPSCLNCPYECNGDEPVFRSLAHRKRIRNKRIRELASEGRTAPGLAREFNLSVRSIQRIL